MLMPGRGRTALFDVMGVRRFDKYVPDWGSQVDKNARQGAIEAAKARAKASGRKWLPIEEYLRRKRR